jgi:ABC-type branched-subunit amino acid transport system substrate-binding protein
VRRIPDSVIAGYPDATRPPAPHTDPELKRLLRMTVGTVAIGHGRHPASVAAAAEFAEAFTKAGGTVAAVVHWPASAASWLRAAGRLVAPGPDYWVLADTAAGAAQVARRLADQPEWRAGRTLGFASLGTAQLVTLGADAVVGMTGALPDGGTWCVRSGLLVRNLRTN